MRTIVTVICIIALLLSFVLGERIYVRNFCVEFSDEIKVFEKSVIENGNPVKDINNIVKNWEKKKMYIFVFENHSNFKEIESGVYSIRYLTEIHEYDEALLRSNALYHKINELYESTEFSLGNLL